MASTVTPKCGGCGRRFPFRRELDGRCPKCLMLQPHVKSSPEYKEIMMWKQCDGCGDVSEHATASRCDDCKEHATAIDALPTTASQPPLAQVPSSGGFQGIYSPVWERQEFSLGEEMLKQRALATQVRMSGHSRHSQAPTSNLQSNASALPATQSAPVTALASSSVKIWVFVEVVQARSKKTPFAKVADIVSGDTTLPTIIERVLDKYMNPKWTKTHTHNLETTDLEVTWAKAMTLEDGTSSLALNDFYNHYNGRSWTSTHRSSAWKDHHAVKQSQKFVQLEIVINDSLFKARTEAENVNIGTVARTKRKRSNTLARETLQPSRSAVASVNYALPPSISELKSVEFTGFTKMTCKLAENIFDLDKILWFEEEEKLYGRICTTALARGAIKEAHELLIDGKKYVAKAVFAFDRSGRAPTSRENKHEVMREHVRLRLIDWALGQFLTVARQSEIPVATNIAVTDSFVIETDLEIGGQVFFIVEPFRTPSTRKFTSSLAHGTQGNSKIEQTIAAFTHFVYAKWNQTLVYADAQGSPSPIGGRDGYILFDPVFHSEEEAFGVADLGAEGIDSFTKTHICNGFCYRFAQVSTSMGNSLAFLSDNIESQVERPRKRTRLSNGGSSSFSGKPEIASNSRSRRASWCQVPDSDDDEEPQAREEGEGEEDPDTGKLASNEKEGSPRGDEGSADEAEAEKLA